MKKEDNNIHSDTTRCKRGRPDKNQNKTIHSKLDNSLEEVICMSDNVTTSNVKSGHTNSLQCYICFKQFLWFDDLQVHLNIHTEEKPYVCPVCQCRFCEWDALKTHSMVHIAKDKEVPEDEKSEQIQSDINLEEKIASISESDVVSLKMSEKSVDGVVESSVQRQLKPHRNAKSHNGETRFKCNICSMGFNYKEEFQSHMKSHIGEKLKKKLFQRRGASVDGPSTSTKHKTPKPLESEGDCEKNIANNSERALPLSRRNKKWKSLTCNYCKTGFAKTSILELHVKTHTSKANPWLCNNCQQSFSKQDALKSHLNFHGEEKHWICDDCRKRFKRPSELGRHMLFHTEGRPYKCNICKMGFKQKTSLRIHHSRVHTEEKPFICGFCHHQFKYEEEFKIHVPKCLPKTHECSESSFAEEANVKNEEVRLNELVDEKSAPEFQLAKSVHEFSIDGLESFSSNISGKSYNNLRTHSEIPRDERAVQLQSDKNLEGKTASISRSGVLSLELSEESSDDTAKSFVCKYCKTGFVDPKFLESHSKEHLSDKPWTCNHCQESFHEEPLRRLHHRNSHAGENHCICHTCKKRFKSTGDLSKHLLIHIGKKPFKCNTCDKCFTQKANLQVHRMTHTGGKRFKCIVCSRGFKHKQKLHFHLSSHNGEKQTKLLFQRTAASGDEPNTSTEGLTPEPLQLQKNCENKMANEAEMAEKRKSLICKYCKTGFTETSTLEFHSKTHTAEYPWLCNKCQESFPKQNALISHRQISHAGEKDWNCHECGKRFKTAGNLNQHLIIHTGTKPFKCENCSKRFNQKTNLRTHQRVHTGEKPYVCTSCNKRFRSADWFKNHDRTCKLKLVKSRTGGNSKIRPGAIVIDSEKQVDNESSEPLHKKIIEPLAENNMADRAEVQNKKSTNRLHNSTICNYCKTGFLEPNAMKIHIQSSHRGKNPWICNHCQRNFQNQLKLKSHRRISHAGEKHFICQMCQKRFRSIPQLNRHLLIHTGEKPFKCKICKKRFNQKGSLRIHERVHTGEKPFVCGFCHQRFKYGTRFKRHVQKCLPKTHQSSESSFGENKNVENEEVCLNEISDERSACVIQATTIVHGFTIEGSEKRAPKVSSDIYTQTPCCSSSLSYQENTCTENAQDQFDKIEITEKSIEPEELTQSTDIGTTTCAKLSEENRRQEWTSFLKVFNVKVARKF